MDTTNTSTNNINIDDLFYLIGKKDVELLSLDKKVKAAQPQLINAKVLHEQNIAYKSEIEKLKNSNTTLSQKNIELDKALTECRKKLIELEKLKNSNTNLAKKNIELINDLTDCKKELNTEKEKHVVKKYESKKKKLKYRG